MAGSEGQGDILLTGGGGQVGTELQRLAPAGWRIAAPGRDVMDLGDPDSIAAYFDTRPWAAVINAGAYTAVDRAETDAVTAWRVNALAPAALAAATAEAGLPLVHLSTDYVFDGAKSEPYVETDPVGPLGVYGASKEGGEQAVRTGNPRHVILRTAWVVSPHGSNFLKTMLRLGADRPQLRVVADQFGCPTSAADIAQAVIAVTDRLLADPDAPRGTYHVVNAGEASWHGLAQAIFSRAEAYGRAAPQVDPIPAVDYPTPARRPANSRLSTLKLQRDFGFTPRPWPAAIDEVLATLLAGSAERSVR